MEGPAARRTPRPLPLALVAGANLVLAFVFQWYVVAALGAERGTDALFAAMIVPQLVLSVTVASLAGVLVPLLSARERPGEAAWPLLHVATGAAVVLAAALFLSASVWMGWVAPGFAEGTKELAVTLVRIQLLGLPFSVLGTVLWAVAYARDRFVWAESAPLVATGIGLALLFPALPRWGVEAAAWILAFRPFVHSAILVGVMGRFRPPGRGGGIVTEAWRRLRPLVLGTSYYKSEELVDRLLASMAPPGGLTLLYLAQRIWGAGQAILSRALVAPLVPRLSRIAERGDWADFRRVLSRRVLLLTLLLLPAALLVALAGDPLLGLLFRGTRVGPGEVEVLSAILVALTGMWVGGVLGELLSAAFYAQGDTTTPTRVGVAGFTAGIAMKVGGFYLWGIVGIALATSAYYLLNMALLSIFLARRVRRRERGPVGTGA